MNVLLLESNVSPEELGLLPHFLSDKDARPAREQFHENYAHGGGWQPLPAYRMEGINLEYPGDPPYTPIAMMQLRRETVLIYRYGIVAIVQPDGSFEASRLD
jgi:hypothetical protein